MSNSPYAPPKSEVADAPSEGGSPAKAVILGVVTDIGGTMVVGLITSFLVMGFWSSQGMNEENMMALLESQSFGSPVMVVQTILGLLCSYLGGFVCARIARKSELRYAGITAAISVGIGVMLSLNSTPILQLLLLGALSTASILLGAVHARKKN